MKNRFSSFAITCLLCAFAVFSQSPMAAADAPKIALSPSSFSDPLDIVTHFDAPGSMPVDVAFDGTHLWCADAGQSKIYQLDTEGNEISSLDSPGMMPFAVTFGQDHLWVSVFESETVYKMDTDGNVVASFSSPVGLLMGLAFDDGHLWASSEKGKIYKLDTDGNILSSFDAPGNDPTGLAFDGIHLWNTDSQSNRIYQLDTDGKVLASFDSPADKAYGLAYDGEHLWHTDDGGDRIFQISPQISPAKIGSSETRSFSVRNIGDAPLGVEQLVIKGENAGEFALKNDECSGQTIAPSGFLMFDVVFSPSSAGIKNAFLEIPSDDPENPVLSLPLNRTAEGEGYLADEELWIRAVINSEDGEQIEAVWKKGGQDETEGGDKVIWGYFHANPEDVNWGSRENPDLFVKIWFDRGGRVDVNFFHVSVPEIEVFSDYPYDESPDQSATTTMARRYVRQYYENGISDMEEQEEDGNPPDMQTPVWKPSGYALKNDIRIASVINTEGEGPIDALWHKGGASLTDGGHEVVWGYFYASPEDVNWGNPNNPDLFVKVWFDASGRIDVNFFHVSVPDIEVYSDFPDQENYDKKGTTILENRYIRHEYQR